jgi:lipid A ethanolaminephosphotransferase
VSLKTLSPQKKATLVSSSVATVLLLVKLVIGVASGSVAVLASAIDSLLDMLVSIFNFFAIKKSEEEACDDYQYGKGKLSVERKIMGLLQNFFHKQITQYHLIVLVSLFFVLFGNISFFSNVTNIYPLSFNHSFHLLSLFFVLTAVITFFFTLLSSKYTTKPLLILTLLISSFTSYFMDTYHVVIDKGMIQNTLQTNLNESMDLFSFQLVGYLLFLGILPSLYVYYKPIKYYALHKELWIKIKFLFLSLGIIGLLLISFSQFYASFFREHKPLRYYTNPSYWIYSVGEYSQLFSKRVPATIKPLGTDAHIALDEQEKKLVIMVVGEAARADRFSLNGYKNETNPRLKQEENLINFSQVSSCGTSTAVSVPCMFSLYGKDDYSDRQAASTENLLDVLKHTKEVEILWRDNNSNSKGVANRVRYEDFKSPKNNPLCDKECRDEGMLAGLETYINQNSQKHILIILHMMGNHGPAYYKRYPETFETFTPVCRTNQLEACSTEAISNAYDNAILYTDYFLSKVIHFLKPYATRYKTAMFYISDHGESLGENGLYLHGLPYFMAPDTQTHIASMVWLEGKIEEDIEIETLRGYSNKPFSHDHVFHSMLGLFRVKSTIYDPQMDIFFAAMHTSQ